MAAPFPQVALVDDQDAVGLGGEGEVWVIMMIARPAIRRRSGSMRNAIRPRYRENLGISLALNGRRPLTRAVDDTRGRHPRTGCRPPLACRSRRRSVLRVGDRRRLRGSVAPQGLSGGRCPPTGWPRARPPGGRPGCGRGSRRRSRGPPRGRSAPTRGRRRARRRRRA